MSATQFTDVSADRSLYLVGYVEVVVLRHVTMAPFRMMGAVASEMDGNSGLRNVWRTEGTDDICGKLQCASIVSILDRRGRCCIFDDAESDLTFTTEDPSATISRLRSLHVNSRTRHPDEQTFCTTQHPNPTLITERSPFPPKHPPTPPCQIPSSSYTPRHSTSPDPPSTPTHVHPECRHSPLHWNSTIPSPATFLHRTEPRIPVPNRPTYTLSQT